MGKIRKKGPLEREREKERYGADYLSLVRFFFFSKDAYGRLKNQILSQYLRQLAKIETSQERGDFLDLKRTSF